jgi:hypothetical protein
VTTWWLVILHGMVLTMHFVFSFLHQKENLVISQSPAERHSADIELSSTSDSNPAPKIDSFTWIPNHYITSLLFGIIFIIFGNLAGNASSFYLLHDPWEASRRAIKLVFKELFPCTNASIVDLDQMVAAVGGTCLLLLNAYGLVSVKEHD